MDCNSKYGLFPRDSRDILTELGRKSKQHKSTAGSFSHHLAQNVLYGEAEPSPFKTGIIGQNPRFDIGPFSAMDMVSESNYSDYSNTQHNYAPFNSFFSENSNQSNKSFYQQQNDYVGSLEPTMAYYDSLAKSEETENDKTATILALVNKVLDDTDDNFFMDSASLFSEKNTGNESIGELAIKLGDLTLLGNEIKTEPGRRMKQQLSSFHNGGKFYDKPGSRQSYGKEPSMKIVKNESSASRAAFTNTPMKNEKPVFSKRKNEFNIKKKKFTPWMNWYGNQNNYKDQRKTTALDGYGMKPSQNQNFRKYPPSSVAPHDASGQKSKYSSMKYSVSPFWMQYANDSKSEGSSSSNSSVYRDQSSRTSSDSFNYKTATKSNDSGRGPLPPKQARRCRKAYSSVSSSSGGKISECVFCKTNGETSAIYRGHVLKDDQGRTVCRVLQQYVCPLCKATGFNAHTIKYCPKNENPPPIATMTTLKSMRSSTGRKRYGPCSGQIRPLPLEFNRSLLPA